MFVDMELYQHESKEVARPAEDLRGPSDEEEMIEM
jgi:hypothetical protein